MKIINQKEEVEALFQKAIKDETGLTVTQYPKSDEDHLFLSYWDEDNDYSRVFYYNDTEETIEKRILMDDEIIQFLHVKLFSTFIINTVDPNAIMVMEKLVLLWDNEEGKSSARDILEDEYGDSYAQYIAEGDLLGQTWVERQIIVINVSSIYKSCVEIHNEEMDGPFVDFFIEGLLQTIFHEFRHLFYECNEIVPIGENTPYPQNGGMEVYVEMYGNNKAYHNLKAFSNIVQKEQLKSIMRKEEENENAN